MSIALSLTSVNHVPIVHSASSSSSSNVSTATSVKPFSSLRARRSAASSSSAANTPFASFLNISSSSEEMDAADLNFNEDFDTAIVLWNDEVPTILKTHREQMKKQGLKISNEKQLKETEEYSRQFCAWNGRDNVMVQCKSSVGRRYEDFIHAYELATISNLRIDELEEAETLLPSLKERLNTGGCPRGWKIYRRGEERIQVKDGSKIEEGWTEETRDDRAKLLDSLLQEIEKRQKAV